MTIRHDSRPALDSKGWRPAPHSDEGGNPLTTDPTYENLATEPTEIRAKAARVDTRLLNGAEQGTTGRD